MATIKPITYKFKNETGLKLGDTYQKSFKVIEIGRDRDGEFIVGCFNGQNYPDECKICVNTKCPLYPNKES